MNKNDKEDEEVVSFIVCEMTIFMVEFHAILAYSLGCSKSETSKMHSIWIFIYMMLWVTHDKFTGFVLNVHARAAFMMPILENCTLRINLYN